MKTFALVGAAGFVAPRHMKAIKDVGGDLKVVFDPRDSVGVIDRYFPEAEFFVEFERFDRHVDRLRREGQKIDYVSVCSPNYLHDAHCRFALRSDADAICEKPLVLNPWNIDGLAEIERATGRSISTILQLRLHPKVAALKAKIDAANKNDFDVDLTYIAPRGHWYHVSWKGDEARSGGVATNIGIHLFDLLVYFFGPVKKNITHLRERERAAGYLECSRAKVRWYLSVDHRDLPKSSRDKQISYRSISVDSEEVEFSEGFADLHTESYQRILAGDGFGLDAVRPSVEFVSAFRKNPVNPGGGERHPLVARHLT